MIAEIETLKQEMNKIESTVIPTDDVVEEQKLLIETQEQILELTNKEIETLKQEFEKIQTTLLPKDETKLEEAFYTKDVEEWLEFIKNSRTNALKPNEVIFDYEIIKNAQAFALGPMLSYNGKPEACSTSEFSSLEEMKEYLNGKKYILYYILYFLKTAEFDKESFTFKPLDESEKIYTFRGHILE